MLEAAMLSVDLVRGHTWRSEWHPVYGELIESAPRNVQLHFEVDRDLFEKAQGRAAALRVRLAFSQYRDANRQEVAPYRRFDLPGVGSCWMENSRYAITCRSIETRPSLVLASVRTAQGQCQSDGSDGELKPCVPLHVRALMSNLGPLTPLTKQEFSFYGPDAAPGTGPLSPGEALTFSAPELRRRFGTELSLGVFQLSNSGHATISRPSTTDIAADTY
jgi:hypothetical protein